MDIVIFGALVVPSMYLAGRIAEHRGRNFRTWAGIAGIIGPFALPLVYLFPSKTKRPDHCWSRLNVQK